MTGNWAPLKESRRIITAGSSVAARTLSFCFEIEFYWTGRLKEIRNKTNYFTSSRKRRYVLQLLCVLWLSKTKSNAVWTPRIFPVAEDFINHLPSVVSLAFSYKKIEAILQPLSQSCCLDLLTGNLTSYIGIEPPTPLSNSKVVDQKAYKSISYGERWPVAGIMTTQFSVQKP